MQANATLNATDIRVDGNVQAEDAAGVNVGAGSFVGGSIQIVQSGSAQIQSVEIDSDLQVDGNDQALLLANNTIGGNLQAFQNTGGVTITGNTIEEDLQCTGNNPPPTGGENVVAGSAEDQCEDLAGGTPQPSDPPPSNPPPQNLPFSMFLPSVVR